LINSVYSLRYRIYFFVVYSMGLRLGEGICLEIGDIDAANRLVHVRHGKGGKDRYMPLPDATLGVLRRFWSTHRKPRLLFPNGSGNAASACTGTFRNVDTPGLLFKRPEPMALPESSLAHLAAC